MLSPSSTGGRVVICRRALELPPATLCALDGLPRTVYFDTETTGLSTGAGTVIFLAGLARREGANLVVTQYLLPDYPHEHALLAVVVEGLMASDRLVSYNGRSFDIPILLSRLASTSAPLPTPCAESRTTICSPLRAGCGGDVWGRRGWPQWSSGCSGFDGPPTAPARKSPDATSPTCAAPRRPC